MRDVRLLFFGDSFTAGAGDPLGCGWVGRVAAAAMPVTPYNLGIRGETSLDVLVRFEEEARRRMRPGVACGVVFSVGANDVCDEADVASAQTALGGGAELAARGGAARGPGPRVGAARSVSALGELLDGAAALELPALVVGPLPVGEPVPDARVAPLDAAFAALCVERGVPYISVAAEIAAFAPWHEEARAGDGVHPGRAGYDRLAEIVLAGGLTAWIDGLGRLQ
ncbi:MAG TPA: GDSL-type esterase/lipase family protein [Conexibacter sp.]|jgi:lysophospholipase L1-like esterase